MPLVNLLFDAFPLLNEAATTAQKRHCHDWIFEFSPFFCHEVMGSSHGLTSSKDHWEVKPWMLMALANFFFDSIPLFDKGESCVEKPLLQLDFG
jgi:hypothetical protein